jgi:hypothetical protein
MTKAVAKLLALGTALAAAGLAAAAAAGVVPVGSVIQTGNDPETQHDHGEAQVVVARGTGAVAGPWRLTGLARRGDPVSGEAPGHCLQLFLTEPPPGTPIEATMHCRAAGTSELQAGSLPVIDASSGKAELLLFGSAPAEAARLELSSDGATLRTGTTDAGAGADGRSWVIAVPRGNTTGLIRALGKDGQPIGPPLSASAHFARLSEIERIAAATE